MSKKKVALFWSGGKDSALALKRIKQDPELELVTLITTFDKSTSEIKFHGVPEVLISMQAKLMGLPLVRVYIPKDATNNEYEQTLAKYLKLLKAKGVSEIVFGDIELEDIRNYRENFLKQFEIKAVFPLWGMDRNKLLNEFIETGHRAVITAIDEKKLPLSFLGKEISHDLISKLPEDVDRCGENGEYHTFVSFGPLFKLRVQFSKNVTISDGPYTICKLREA